MNQKLAEKRVANGNPTAQDLYHEAERQARESNAPSMLLILTPTGLSIQTNVSGSFGLGMLDIAHTTFMEMFKREFIEGYNGSIIDLPPDIG